MNDTKDTENVTVSVVIPYSQEHTPEWMLEEAMESAESQDIRTEIIVVEDHDQNGPAWARNRGIERAETRYVALLDADDLWIEGKLRKQLAKITENDCGICLEGEERSNKECILDMFLGRLMSVTPSILIDTHRVDTQFDEEIEQKEDHLFVIQAAYEAGACFCRDLVEVRKHTNGVSATTPGKVKIEARKEFAQKCFESVSWLAEYKDEYHRRLYYRIGRQRYIMGDYSRSVVDYKKSLEHGLYWKVLPATLLSIQKLVRSRLIG